MTALSDKTRRKVTLAIFLLLGPAVLLAVAWMVWFRHSGGSIASQETILSETLGFPTNLADVDYLRPDRVAYYGVSVFSDHPDQPDGERPLFFIPAILSVKEKGTFPPDPELLPDRLGATAEPSPDASPDSAAEFLAPIRGELAGVKRFRRWTIPSLSLRAASFGEVLNQFDLFLQNSVEAAKPIPREGVAIFLEIDRVVFLKNNAEIDRARADFLPPKKGKWPDVFGGSKSADDTARDATSPESDKNQVVHGDGSAESLRKAVVDFDASDAPSLEKVRGFFFRSPTASIFALEFRAESIPASRPFFLMTAVRRSEDSRKDRAPSESSPARLRRVAFFDSRGETIPASLVAGALPIFALAGPGSRVSGMITADSTGVPSGRWREETDHRRIILDEFTLCDADLSTPAGRLTSSRARGTIVKLRFDRARIDDGVFRGTGTIYLVAGALDRRFFLRLADALGLTFDPPQTLANSFSDDLVPFEQLLLRFEFGQDGVVFRSEYPTGIIGAASGSGGYRLFLSERSVRTIPYPRLLATPSEEGSDSFWSPFYRDAINHLPVE